MRKSSIYENGKIAECARYLSQKVWKIDILFTIYRLFY